MPDTKILIEYFNRNPLYRKLLNDTYFLSKDRRAQFVYKMWIQHDKSEETKLEKWTIEWNANRIM